MKNTSILGAIAGDILGSAYEFYPVKDYNFNLFNEESAFTDDTVLTMAVADWILHDPELSSLEFHHWSNPIFSIWSGVPVVKATGLLCASSVQTLTS